MSRFWLPSLDGDHRLLGASLKPDRLVFIISPPCLYLMRQLLPDSTEPIDYAAVMVTKRRPLQAMSGDLFSYC